MSSCVVDRARVFPGTYYIPVSHGHPFRVSQVFHAVAFMPSHPTLLFISLCACVYLSLLQVLHGDISQNQRDITINQFRKKQFQVLVATDVAARGIDVSDIDLVVQYRPPRDSGKGGSKRFLLSCSLFFVPSIIFALVFVFLSSPPLLGVTQIRGHIASSSSPSHGRFVPCIFVAKRLEPFIPSSTRVQRDCKDYKI